MKKLLLSGLAAIVLVAAVSAQKPGYDPVNSPYGHGEDSVNCRLNLSLMQTSAKAEDYTGALKPWMSVYENCPASSKNIYIYGPRIFKAFHASETDAAKKKEYLDTVMGIYDSRIKYYGKDDAKGMILAYKAYDYIELMGEQTDQAVVYGLLNEAIEDMKDQMNPLDAYSYFMVASLNEYLGDNSKKDRYITDYFRVVGYVDQAIANFRSANDEASANYLVQVKEGIVRGFISSGAGDCETLTGYYADKVEPSKGDKEFLNEVLDALGSVGCSDTDLYFTAAEYLYVLEPSASAALGLANKSLRDKDYDTAIKYYGDAAKMETDASKASDYMMQLAGIFSNQRNFARARQAAYDALEYNQNNGEAYILIAQLYASSAANIFPEPEKAGLVYLVAVDKLQRARAVDPSVASKANGLITRYSAAFMDTETAFMMGIKAGESVVIPGWIGETTTVRLR
jgi:tetratricopeptide (TPR) repeat protein